MHVTSVKESRTCSRLIVLGVIVAVHAAIFIFLINIRVPPRVDRNDYVSVTWLPQNKRPEDITRPALPSTVVKRSSQKTPLPLSFSAPASAATQTDSKRPIDWAEEAARVAGALTSNAITLPQSSDKTPLRQTPSPFAPPPTHHAGDSYRNEIGETIVWISDMCYQVSGAMLTVPDVMAYAMLPRTACPRLSNKPRGDLFKDLPAYKKLHPDDDAR